LFELGSPASDVPREALESGARACSRRVGAIAFSSWSARPTFRALSTMPIPPRGGLGGARAAARL
jgi:hypothetical protein